MRFTEIDLKNDIVLSDYYNKRISVSHVSNKPLRFQIPRMYMPFGISGFVPEIGPTKWNIDFSMRGWNEDENYIKRFYDFVKNLEEYFINHVDSNKLEIFGNENVVPKNFFNSNIKEDGDRDPKFRIKVDTDHTNTIKPQIFDMNEKNITNTAEKGLYAKNSGVSLVEITSIYFLNKKFGITWRLCQMKVFEPQRLHGFQFNINEDEDDEIDVKGFHFKV